MWFLSAVSSSSMPMRIKPGWATRVVTARTLCEMIWSAAANACWIPSFGSTSEPMRSLSKVISAFETRCSLASASSACAWRRLPSNENGILTKTTTKAPCSCAMRAISGVAPEPVPPPSPAQMKTSLRPSSEAAISLAEAWAACRPISGSPPAPRPCSRSLPSWIFSLATEVFSARISVLSESSSASSMPSSAMRSRTFAPAPPIPMTLTLLYTESGESFS